MFISTDYVFDGRSPPYKIDSEPNPLNKYGKSKLDGEKVVLEASKGARDDQYKCKLMQDCNVIVWQWFSGASILENIVLRVPLLYGPIEFIEESAVTILFRQVSDQKRCNFTSHLLAFTGVLQG